MTESMTAADVGYDVIVLARQREDSGEGSNEMPTRIVGLDALSKGTARALRDALNELLDAPVC